MQGWISIHRQIWDCWVWKDLPFSKGQAWVDLILLANYEDKKMLVDNSLVTVKRGSFLTSQQKLMTRWGWGKEKLLNFLRLLESDGMITVDTRPRFTVISITNYETYQSQTVSKPVISTCTEEAQTEARPKSDRSQTEVRPKSDRSPDQSQTVSKPVISTYTEEAQTEVRPKSDRSQTEVRPKSDRLPATNNNINNINNINNKDIHNASDVPIESDKPKKQPKAKKPKEETKDAFIKIEHLSMTKEEYDKLVADYGTEMVDDILDAIRNYKQKNKYVSLFLTAKQWLKREVQRNPNIYKPMTGLERVAKF